LWNGDLSNHRSQPLTPDVIGRADLIFGMTPDHVDEVLRLSPEARDRTYLFKNFPDQSPDGEGVDDPIGQSLDRYNETFLEIGEYLGKHLPEILKRMDAKTRNA
jgi:protein-tyrosine-phosphatase